MAATDPRIEGAYVALYPRWIDFAASHGDFVWFGAAVCWSLALIVYWRHPQRAALRAWRWLPAAAAVGAGSAAIVLFSFASPMLLPNAGARPSSALASDLALGVLILSGIGTNWVRLAGTPCSRRVLPLLLALLVAFAVFRYDSTALPWLSGWLAALGVASALPWFFQRGADFGSRAALAGFALVPLFSTIGPLPFVFNPQGYQRWSAFNPEGVRAGAFLFAAGALTLAVIGIHSWRSWSPLTRFQFQRSVRPYLLAAAGCLACGVFLASLYAARHREGLHAGLLGRAEFIASSINPEWVRHAVDRPFSAVPPYEMKPWGPVLFVPALAEPTFDPLRAALATTARNGRDLFRSVAIVTLRDERLVVLFTPLSRTKGEVMIARPATNSDREHWTAKDAWAEGPVSLAQGSGMIHFARVPLVGESDGRMLGWVEITSWGGPNGAGARVLLFAATNLVLIVICLLYVQRQHVRREEAARRAEAIAHATSRLQTEFLACVSHELRTPLQVLRAHLEQLDGHASEGSTRSTAAHAQAQSDTILRLVNDLVDLNALEVGTFALHEKPIAIGPLVSETVAGLAPIARAKNLTLHCEIASEVPSRILGDPTRLRQIVLNLTANAIKFTSTGRVDVSLSVVTAGSDAPQLELIVRDTGPGIDMADHGRLFRPFSRLSNAMGQEGSGLGLAIVAALAQRMGGAVEVQSDGRNGSAFRVTLPQRTAATSPEHEARLSLPIDSATTVLVIEDHPELRVLLAGWIEQDGRACVTAANLAEAIDHADRHPIGAVVLDLHLPDGEGPAVPQRLRAHEAFRQVPLVALSAASPPDAAEIKAWGLDAFLTKPVRRAELSALLRLPRPSAEARPVWPKILIDRFAAEAGRQRVDIKSALGKQNWPEVRRLAHQLRSGATVVASEELFRAATRLEENAEQGRESACLHAFRECEAIITAWESDRSKQSGLQN